MPTEFRVDVDAGIVYRTITGEITIDELLASYRSMLAHPDFRPGLRALTDLREVKPSAVRRDVLRLAEFVQEHGEEIGALRVAVVVSTDASFGMVRELEVELAASPVEIGLFRDPAEALAWLGPRASS